MEHKSQTSYYKQPEDSEAWLKHYAGIGTLRQEGFNVSGLPSVVDRRTLEDWRKPAAA